MSIDRRVALARMSALVAAGMHGTLAHAQTAVDSVAGDASPQPRLRTIATEEAFCTPDVAAAIREVLQQGGANLDIPLLNLIFGAPATTPAASSGDAGGSANRDQQARALLPRLLDIGAGRLAEMDANGVDMHVLSLTMPGVQLFARDTAVALARSSNDQLAEAVRRHPRRFAGLASFAPQDPAAAAREMERAIKSLGLSGFIVNSHTGNAYLDDQRFWPIFEAAEALGAPLYLHPRAPSDGMAAPFRDYRIEGAVWGYGVETATHVIRLMFGGVFDRFPRLRLVIGHMGEALPFWLSRLDFMGAPGARGASRKNALRPSEYFGRNIVITTSGVEDPLALRFCIDKIGVENIMWAIDHPFQPTAPAVAFLKGARMTDAESADVAHRNAERIFRIS